MKTSKHLRKKLGKAKIHEAKLWLELRKAHENGEVHKLRGLIHRYFLSFYVRLNAVHQTNLGAKRHRKVSTKKYEGIAEGLNPVTGTDEEVLVHAKEKADNPNDFRVICDFGVENRALQFMALSILKATNDVDQRQFSANGGAGAACTKVKELFKAGYSYHAEIDIIDNYGAFNAERIPDLLNIKKEITKNTLLTKHMALRAGIMEDVVDLEWYDVECDPISAEILSKARQGLPQGSGASSFVSDLLLSPLLQHLPEGSEIVAYADNFMVMSRSKPDATSTIEALRHALLEHPAGPLRSTCSDLYGPGERFRFLGYDFKPKLGMYRLYPMEESRGKFESIFSTLLNRISVPGLTARQRKKRHQDLHRYVCSWTSSYSLWSGASELRNQKLTLARKRMDAHKKPKHFLQSKKSKTGPTKGVKIIEANSSDHTKSRNTDTPPWE